ncbi:MAG: hypothetical protein QXP58_07080 [Thermoprotei archaeon]
MPTPDRRYVRGEARIVFLRRMYPATGIFRYGAPLDTVVRHTENIPLYSVERLQLILFGFRFYTNFDYEYYFWEQVLQDYYEHRVGDARFKVEDWRGIP